MNMPTHHQDDLFRALAVKADLRVVYDHALVASRKELGWSDARGEYGFRVLDPNRKLRDAVRIAREERGRLHVVNGIWAEPAFAAAAVVLGMASVRFAIYAEAPDGRVSRSFLRRRLRDVFGGWVARRAAALLAVSHFASDYYERVGFVPERIYPFGYFRELRASGAVIAGRTLNIVFVGQFIHRKGVDILLQAITPVLKDHPCLRLGLVGTGPDRESIETGIKAAGIADQVELEGVLPSAQMRDRLGRAHLLVLPSRWDGWGMVVNEALCAGLPVIVSDRCGASDLVCHGVNGYVFRSEDVSDLRSCLRAFMAADQQQMRAAAIQTSSALAIPVVANYLVECLEHMSGLRAERPVPPWQQVVADLRGRSGSTAIANR
jgi:glycosyltransferase involved in cell wall biosynthesis